MDDKHLFSHVVQNTPFTRRGFLQRTGSAGVAALAASGLAGSLLAACGGEASPSTGTGGVAPKGTKIEGKLTLAYLGTADQQKSWNAVFDLFRKKYPDVELQAQGNPVDNWAAFFDTISTQIAGGKIPDIVQVATEGQRLFASRNLVQPIDEYLERDKDELTEYFADVHPNLVKWCDTLSSHDGKKYYLPGEFNTMGLWCNMEVFQKAGVPEPDDSWTWDDFLAAAKQITKPGEVYGIHISAGYFVSVMPWLLTNGASTLNADWTQATVNTPQAIEAANFMRSLVEQGISPKPGGKFDAITASAQGKLAMFGGGRWPVINVREQGFVDKIKIMAWPQKTQQGSPVGWNGYPIMQASKNKEAAWAFVKFTTSKEAIEHFVSKGGTIVPARKSVVTSDAYLANAPKGMEKLYDALEYATPIPSPNKGNVVQKDIEDTWEQILVGNVTAEQGLADLNQKIQANL